MITSFLKEKGKEFLILLSVTVSRYGNVWKELVALNLICIYDYSATA